MRIRFIPAELAWDSYEGVTQVLWGRKFQQKFLLYRNPLTGQICWNCIYCAKKGATGWHLFARSICNIKQYLQCNISPLPLTWAATSGKLAWLLIQTSNWVKTSTMGGWAIVLQPRKKGFWEQMGWICFGNSVKYEKKRFLGNKRVRFHLTKIYL